jgi:hypothetical protein
VQLVLTESTIIYYIIRRHRVVPETGFLKEEEAISEAILLNNNLIGQQETDNFLTSD